MPSGTARALSFCPSPTCRRKGGVHTISRWGTAPRRTDTDMGAVGARCAVPAFSSFPRNSRLRGNDREHAGGDACEGGVPTQERGNDHNTPSLRARRSNPEIERLGLGVAEGFTPPAGAAATGQGPPRPGRQPPAGCRRHAPAPPGAAPCRPACPADRSSRAVPPRRYGRQA